MCGASVYNWDDLLVNAGDVSKAIGFAAAVSWLTLGLYYDGI